MISLLKSENESISNIIKNHPSRGEDILKIEGLLTEILFLK